MCMLSLINLAFVSPAYRASAWKAKTGRGRDFSSAALVSWHPNQKASEEHEQYSAPLNSLYPD